VKLDATRLLIERLVVVALTGLGLFLLPNKSFSREFREKSWRDVTDLQHRLGRFANS
jgi:hypothetical protein